MKAHIHPPAPNFSLPSDGGLVHVPRDYRDQKLLLVFYQKDFSPQSLGHLSMVKTLMPNLVKENIQPLAISRDFVSFHRYFQSCVSFPFPLLSDVQGHVCALYGVWKKYNVPRMDLTYGAIEPTAFLIGKEGGIEKITPMAGLMDPVDLIHG